LEDESSEKESGYDEFYKATVSMTMLNDNKT
jgi:predicted nucleic-acid-binding Zn-ribbon protein